MISCSTSSNNCLLLFTLKQNFEFLPGEVCAIFCFLSPKSCFKFAICCQNLSRNSLVLHCASLLRTILASSARAHERVHVQNVRDFPQTKLDNGINSPFLLNEFGEPPFFFQVFVSCWDCQDFYIGKTKRRLHDRKTEHFKGITSSCHASAIADHVTSTGHNLKWDHFEIFAKGRSDTHCKIKETLLIQELKPTLNDTVSSEKLYLY